MHGVGAMVASLDDKVVALAFFCTAKRSHRVMRIGCGRFLLGIKQSHPPSTHAGNTPEWHIVLLRCNTAFGVIVFH
eukprot:m.17773 g.17773  ORF g.17773 m.17773 type:complete len:76 (+) comp11310_c0_seq1:295-522(+)